jgi:hypothetical protein
MTPSVFGQALFYNRRLPGHAGLCVKKPAIANFFTWIPTRFRASFLRVFRITRTQIPLGSFAFYQSMPVGCKKKMPLAAFF